MNTKIEEYQKIHELFEKMSDEDKAKLNELLLSHKDEYAVEPLETVKKCVQEMIRQTMQEFTDYVNGQISESSDGNYARTIYDSQRVERGKAFVEAMSSQARANEEAMQQRRDERYEQMIEEAGEIESPANRLRH